MLIDFCMMLDLRAVKNVYIYISLSLKKNEDGNVDVGT